MYFNVPHPFALLRECRVLALSIVVRSPVVKHKIGFNPAIPSVFSGQCYLHENSLRRQNPSVTHDMFCPVLETHYACDYIKGSLAVKKPVWLCLNPLILKFI